MTNNIFLSLFHSLNWDAEAELAHALSGNQEEGKSEARRRKVQEGLLMRYSR